jgi:hypothetical protein
MSVAIAGLAVASFVFTIWGIFKGARAIHREVTTLATDLDKVQRITHDPNPDFTEKRDRMADVRAPSTNYTNTISMLEHVRLAVLDHAYQNLKVPALLVFRDSIRITWRCCPAAS